MAEKAGMDVYTCCGGRVPIRGVLVIIGGMLIHLTLGTQLTYGNSNPYVVSYIRKYSSPSDLRLVDGTWIQACMQMGRGLTMFLGGIMEKKLGPRLTCLVGSWTLSLGVLLTHFAVKTSFLTSVLSYGVLFGLGCGLTYSTPITCAIRWFPDHPGLVCGIIFLGFGSGTTVFNQITTFYLNPDNLAPGLPEGDDVYFTQEEILKRVPVYFVLMSIVFAAMQLIGALLVTDPPRLQPGKDTVNQPPTTKYGTSDRSSDKECLWHSSGKIDTEPQDSKEKTVCQNESAQQTAKMTEGLGGDVAPLQMLRSKQFYIVWFIFLFGGYGAVFMEAMYKSYGQSFIQDDHFIAFVGSCAAVVNSLGGIFWGYLADKITFSVTLKILFALFATMAFTLSGAEYGGKACFLIWICLLMLAVAGKFTVMAAITARLFGQKHLSVNNGLLHTSQIVTPILSALMAVSLMNYVHYHGLLFIIGASSTVGFLLIFLFDRTLPTGFVV